MPQDLPHSPNKALPLPEMHNQRMLAFWIPPLLWTQNFDKRTKKANLLACLTIIGG
jgi:hypothetical protein